LNVIACFRSLLNHSSLIDTNEDCIGHRKVGAKNLEILMMILLLRRILFLPQMVHTTRKLTYYTILSFVLIFQHIELIIHFAQADDQLIKIEYAMSIKGLNDEVIVEKFNNLSLLKTLENKPVYSLYTIKKRICEDYTTLCNLLDSYGYFDSQIRVDDTTEEYQSTIVFVIDTGERYRIKHIVIDFGAYPHNVSEVLCDVLEYLPAKENSCVNSEEIHKSFEIVLDHLSQCGYPYAKLKEHALELDKDEKQAILTMRFDTGPLIRFGHVKVLGNTDIPEQYIINRAPWEVGDIFDKRIIENYREKLNKTSLFNVVDIQYPPQFIQNECTPITVSVSEKKPRTVSAGLKYSLDDGPGALLEWVHRNFSGRADRFSASLEISQVLSKLDANHDLPDFWQKDTTLSSSCEVKREDTDAYKSASFGVMELLRRDFAEHSQYFYGISLEHDRVMQFPDEQPNITKRSYTVGVPVGLKFDTRDNILDPQKGYVFNIAVTPKFGSIGSSNFMTRAVTDVSHYYTIIPNFILASWSRIGSLIDINFSNILANQRFYSGSGGSVRGYGYQLAGPLNNDGDPIGGKSLVELGCEARVRFSEDWGGVTFIEASHVGDKSMPSFNKNILCGAGIGLRYYTMFGPIRGDIAMPFKRRHLENGKTVDARFLFYISIGQSF
jgi:translocation and assembly module TamA